MSTLEILLYGQIGASIMMFFAWMHAIWIKNTSYVDVLWAYGVGILGFIFLSFEEELCDPARLALLKALILTWSVRLGTYLLKRCIGKPEDARYYELDEKYRFNIGELLKVKRGQCRHQCVAEMLLLQRAGIDARLASGAANTGGGNYRGLHLWLEINLADDSRYLSDQTWKDEAVPLWDGAYDRDKRRLEIYKRTEDFARYLAA